MEIVLKSYLRKNLRLLIILAISNVIFYSVCFVSSDIVKHQNTARSITSKLFNNASDKPLFLSSNIPAFYKSFSIEFESDFLPKDDNYGNIFQAGDDPKTLRLELMHPQALQVVIGYKDDPGVVVYPVSKKVRMNAWNHIKLSYLINKKLSIKLNDEPTIYFANTKHDVIMNNLVLGTGYNRLRTFVGLIKNAKFSLVFHETNIYSSILSSLARNYRVLLLFQLFFLAGSYLRKQNPRQYDNRETFFDFLKIFSIIATVVLISGLFSLPLIGQRKWIPYLCLLLPSIAFGANLIKTEFLHKKFVTLIACIVPLVVLALGIFNYENISWFGISGILITCCYIAVMLVTKQVYLFFISAGTYIFLFGINSIVFMNNYGTQDYAWTAIVIMITLCAFVFSLPGQEHITRWTKVNKIGSIILIIIAGLLALRSDTLFLGSSEFHWSYFTGVIQTIHSGGQLLWSAPSQYGFLNILLPSILPLTSRNAFFVFQAALFVICIAIIIKTIYQCFKNSAVFIVISLISLSLFYFADPAIIGPTLYPSSSAVRFFCCYLLIAALVWEYHKDTILQVRTKWLITSIYILGALWSAESLLYCTAIYGSYLFCCAIAHFKLKTNKIHLFLLKNISIIFVLGIVFTIGYLVITHHLPDWSMHVMYAFGYANGFGELPISSGGIHWAVIITLSGIIFVTSRLYTMKKYSQWVVASVCFVSLWALMSYYVGRAVPNNLTALLPLFFYIFIILILVLMDAKLISYRLLVNAVFLPWIVVGVIGGIGNPQFMEKVKTFSYGGNIDSKSFHQDRELNNIISSLKSTKGTRISYYGDLYSNPVISLTNGRYMDANVSLPMPMTLLEEPISEKRRAIVVERFLENVHEPVYIIHRKDEILGRFPMWKKFLERHSIVEKSKVGSNTYEVFIVKHKNK